MMSLFELLYCFDKNLEEEHFLKTILEFSPVFYRRYVDDTFALFNKYDQANSFLTFINSVDSSIQFDVEYEENNSLPFLDTLVSRVSIQLYPDVSTRIKPTDKGLFYSFDNFVPFAFKNNLMLTVIYLVFNIASSFNIFHENLQMLKSKFIKNGFSASLFDAATNRFLSKQYNNTQLITYG